VSEALDMGAFVAPKSNQLNADDLIAGPRTVTITRVVASGNADQPVAVHFEGDGGKPYLPCKSMRRVMIAAWTADTSLYIGRGMTLYRDPKVAFGGMEVGGIRISHLSHIDKPMGLALTVTKAKRAPYVVQPLRMAPPAEPKPTPPAGLPILAPDGSLRRVSKGVWASKIKEVLYRLESSEALRQWRQAMGPHIGAVAEGDNVMASEADALIEARLAELADAEGA